MNIEMALKSRSYILDLDRVNFPWEFSISKLFDGDFFHQLSGSTFIFVKTHTPKSRKFNVWHNFTCGTDSCVVLLRAIYTALPYTTLPFTALPYTTVSYTALPYTALHYTTLPYTAHTALAYTALH